MREVLDTAPPAAFWSWWSTVADAVASSLDERPPSTLDPALSAALSAQVRALHPKLGHQLAPAGDQGERVEETPPGAPPRHRLWLTSKGDPLLRAVAERWLRAAPSHPRWRYYAAAQRRPGKPGNLQLDEQTVAFGDLLASGQVDHGREVIDLVVSHDTFDRLSPATRAQITFAALDALLGEDDVDRWIGNVELEPTAPPLARPITELVREVDLLAASATSERWAVRRGQIDDSPLVVTFNQALKLVDHVLLDRHARVDIRLRQPNARGLASQREVDALEVLERELRAELGELAVLIGRETHRGHRVLHLHVAPDPMVLSKLDAFKSRCTDRDVAILVQPDPRWEVLRRWG